MENDQTSIQIDSLAKIMDALGTNLAEFFGDVETQVVFAAKDRVRIDGKGVHCFELLVPGSTNNQMDPILLEIKPGEGLEENEPHPGEQFGFILQGTATLKLGQKTYRVSKGHCFYFEADRSQQ
ncbi:MAG: cupin domain-containing protein, partial [Candidatus Zixiibacteriota bacterium]